MTRKSRTLVLHALPSEAVSWLRDWVRRSGLSVALLWIEPFLVVVVTTDGEFGSSVERHGVPFRVCFVRGVVDESSSGLFGFAAANVCEACFDVGQWRDGGLGESSLVVESGGMGVKFWSSAVREVVKATRAGMWAVSPTGARGFSRNNRYTKGALDFARGGGRLLPVAGWNHFEIDGSADFD